MRTAHSIFVAFTAAVLFLTTPTLGHMAMGYPPTQGGPGPNRKVARDVHAWLGFKLDGLPRKPFPCGGYEKGPVTTFKAGEVVNVRFWNFDIAADFDPTKLPTRKGIQSARHGGGACEFSLSYDGGKKWWVIGQYTKTCPDLYYEWPVLIPQNIRSCLDSNKCLFAWSWVAHRIGQYYHHCANVKILGQNNGKIPTLPMTVVDVKQLGQPDTTTAEGDDKDNTSTGPDPEEKKKNLEGFFAPGSKGFDLLLKTPGNGGKGSKPSED